ncbi:MAG: SPOR domain-containing protein [Gammaproteobacteria bacterium]|nr:SPOR domain-containing protein [Gammaproteobacteria bacterium]
MASKAMAKKKKKSNKSAPLPGWVWLATGLMIGLFVAFLVHIKDNYPGLSLKDNKQTASSTDARSVRKQAQTKTPVKEKTRFDFYTILPEMEIAVPDDELSTSSNKAAKPMTKPGTYILQAGSFKTLEQADRMKANLALLGIEANIESVTINNKESWHRVRIGPYRNLDNLNRTRSRLKQNNIDALLLKLKT